MNKVPDFVDEAPIEVASVSQSGYRCTILGLIFLVFTGTSEGSGKDVSLIIYIFPIFDIFLSYWFFIPWNDLLYRLLIKDDLYSSLTAYSNLTYDSLSWKFLGAERSHPHLLRGYTCWLLLLISLSL